MTVTKRMILGASCAAIATMMTITSAQAQAPQAQRVVRIDIKAQPLGTALRLLGRQMHVQLVFDEAALGGRVAPSVNGAMTADAAIGRLLQGSGLTMSRTGQGVYVITRPAALTRVAMTVPGTAQDRAAADTEVDTAPTPPPGGDIVVTGSRIRSKNLVETAPVTSVTQADIKLQAAFSVQEVLNRVPAIKNSDTNL